MPARTSTDADAPAAPSFHATAQVMRFIATQEVHINGAVKL